MKFNANLRKAGLYLDEFAYVMSVPGGKNRAKLLYHTIGYHWQNLRKLPVDQSSTIDVTIPLGNDPRVITIRPYAGDMAILYEVMCRSAYEIPESIIHPDNVETIVDAGAHIGIAAIYMAKRYPKARIICLEPNPDNFALLCKNTSSEPRITPIQACLTGTAADDVYIWTTGRTSHFQINTDGNGTRVPAKTIDQVCAEHDIDRINLLKLDIEGAESEVLAHPSFLNRIDAITAELHDPYGVAEFSSDIRPFGFTIEQRELVLAYKV